MALDVGRSMTAARVGEVLVGLMCQRGAPVHLRSDNAPEFIAKPIRVRSRAPGDHGDIGRLLPVDGGDCEAVLAEFARAGIDTDALAARLQDEGAQSFVKSWNELMSVIASKSAALAKAG